MSDIEFVPGLFVKAPREGAPDFVKSSMSIKPAELYAWLGERLSDERVNIDVKEAKSGKWYAAVDNWKPNGERQDKPKPAKTGGGGSTGDAFEDESIPFITNRGKF